MSGCGVAMLVQGMNEIDRREAAGGGGRKEGGGEKY